VPSRTKRLRDAQGVPTTLDLTSASQAAREFVVKETDITKGGRFLGFTWLKSTGQVVTYTIVRKDADTGNEFVIEKATDAGELDGAWRPYDEETQGSDVEKPSAAGSSWILRCSQAGAACSLTPLADFQEA